MKKDHAVEFDDDIGGFPDKNWGAIESHAMSFFGSLAFSINPYPMFNEV